MLDGPTISSHRQVFTTHLQHINNKERINKCYSNSETARHKFTKENCAHIVIAHFFVKTDVEDQIQMPIVIEQKLM